MSQTLSADLPGRVITPLNNISARKPAVNNKELLEERFALAALLSLCPKAEPPMTVADALLKQYGSLGHVLAVAVHNEKFEELEEGVCEFLQIIHRAMFVSLRSRIEKRPILDSFGGLRDYLHFSLAHSDLEEVRLLLLNAKNVLIADEVHSVGSSSRVAVYVREIAKRAIITGATALIVVHNHPSGDVAVSAADLAMYKQLSSALKSLEVCLHDFIIVGSGGYRSFREDQVL